MLFLIFRLFLSAGWGGGLTNLVAMALRLGVCGTDQEDQQLLAPGEEGEPLWRSEDRQEVCEAEATRRTNKGKKKAFQVKRDSRQTGHSGQDTEWL